MRSFGKRLLQISHRDDWVLFSPLIDFDRIQTNGADARSDTAEDHIFNNAFFREIREQQKKQRRESMPDD